MNKTGSFLECDSSILEKNLKFVKNEYEDEFQNIFGGTENLRKEEENSKIVKPTPGMCIKAYKLNTNEKFFINLCQTDGIPPPDEITENELTDILQSDTPSSFRIPMSISQTRSSEDNSGNAVDVCDIAINPNFFNKCEKILLFRDFLISLILEALDDKYNIQLKTDNWLILKNRKFMGTLVSHRVRNTDVKTVLESYKNPTENEKKMIQEITEADSSHSAVGKKLIHEISEKEASNIVSSADSSGKDRSQKIKESIALANSIIPQHKIFTVTKNGSVSELLAEFWLPECISGHEISLDVGEDRIFLESMKRGYLFDKFTNYKLNQDKVDAVFDSKDKMLRLRCALLI